MVQTAPVACRPTRPVASAAVIAPFGSDGEWLRCQLHSHTTNSDGEATPEGLVEHYVRAGFDVLAITDHWHITTHAHDELLLIPSSELSAKLEGRGEFDADVLAYGIDVLPDPAEEFPSIADAAEWIVGQGGVAYLAHPYWSGLRAEDYLAAPALSGIEVMNGGSELMQRNGLSVVHWDDILHLGGALPRDRDRRLALPGPGQPARVDDGAGSGAVARGGRRGAPRRQLLRHVRRNDPSAIEVDDGGVEVAAGPARSITVRSGPWDGCGVNAAPLAMNWRGRVLERARRRRDHPGPVRAARVLEVGPGRGRLRRRCPGLVEPLRRGLSGLPAVPCDRWHGTPRSRSGCAA